MKRLLVQTDRNTAAWVDCPRSMTSDDYGILYSEFSRATGCRTWGGCILFDIWETAGPDAGPDAVPFHTELAGPDGCSAILFRLPGHTSGQVKRARAAICHQRDVVRSQVLGIDKIIPFDVPAVLARAKAREWAPLPWHVTSTGEVFA